MNFSSYFRSERSRDMYARTDLASLRVKKDINELSTARFTCEQTSTCIEFPNGMENMLQLKVIVSVLSNAGAYSNGHFSFLIDIPSTYPFHAPKVICLHKIWHPNIDPISGFVMLPILGSDWRPVLSINTVLLGLQLLFLEPNPKFSVNMSAAEQLIADPTQFAEKIQEILHGGSFFGISFPSCVQLGKKGRSRDDEEEPIEFIKKRRRA